jgi:uncharacterized membrane protein YgcG
MSYKPSIKAVIIAFAFLIIGIGAGILYVRSGTAMNRIPKAEPKPSAVIPSKTTESAQTTNREAVQSAVSTTPPSNVPLSNGADIGTATPSDTVPTPTAPHSIQSSGSQTTSSNSGRDSGSHSGSGKNSGSGSSGGSSGSDDSSPSLLQSVGNAISNIL